ncbi:hypothetical protein K402DRAFT_329073 [Aulographum hederae CBS 113979]|uniref:Importin N-terminal domain-containing protein n=1 Tax=Aulographum hederae CBS 113979 TaxID=1176131 RepID=A0A6G1H549_9PEZI|nr:hypothetical protein K402DRAFT_329073 [Aulographum hederae CBS 113979]
MSTQTSAGQWPTAQWTQTASSASAPGAPAEFARILEALRVVHDPNPTADNSARRDATQYLDRAKRLPTAFSHGMSIASDRTQSAELRHYGLSMLEFTITYSWDSYPQEVTEVLQENVVRLAQDVNDRDPSFVRNKVGQLWIEATKRSWGIQWMSMDEQLQQLWQSSVCHQALVLYILETLTDELFSKDEPFTGPRAHELKSLLWEITLPWNQLSERIRSRANEPGFHARHGTDGWMSRVDAKLKGYLQTDRNLRNELGHTCIVRSLGALRAAMSFTPPACATSCLDSILAGLADSLSTDIQIAAADALIIISRRIHNDDDFVRIIRPLLSDQVSVFFRHPSLWASIDEIDHPKYTLSKKVAELLGELGRQVELHMAILDREVDIPHLLDVYFHGMSHPSLAVAIPFVHHLSRLLYFPTVSAHPKLQSSIAPLLTFCGGRLVRYEWFPESSEDVTYRFLCEDCDTVAEQHLFLGNYRRYSTEMIENLVGLVPRDAVPHVLQLTESVIAEAHRAESTQPSEYAKNSVLALSVEGAVTFVQAMAKGYQRHRNSVSSEQQANLDRVIEQWVDIMSFVNYDNPDMRKSLADAVVSVCAETLQGKPEVSIRLLQHLVDLMMKSDNDYIEYAEAVKALKGACMGHIRTLMKSSPDVFFANLDLCKRLFDQKLSVISDDPRALSEDFVACCLSVIQRTSLLGVDEKKSRLAALIQPVKEQWENLEFLESLSSFQSFCNMMGLGRLVEYLRARRFDQTPDWSTALLDQEGKDLISSAREQFYNLPLSATKKYISAFPERADRPNRSFDVSVDLWLELAPAMLQNIFLLVSYAQAFTNLTYWGGAPQETVAVFHKIFAERFWQKGISSESREDFYSKVSRSKQTYEGFASTIRGLSRDIRDVSYHIIYKMSGFGERFYGMPGLPGALSEALYTHSTSLSCHHFGVLLNMSSGLIGNCPRNQWEQFLPAIISSLFTQVNTKLTAEWAVNGERSARNASDTELADEMRDESVLRQVSWNAVALACSLLELPRETAPISNPPAEPHMRELSEFVVTTPVMLQPVLALVKNAIGMRDIRCCKNAVRTLIDSFRHLKILKRAFLCDDVLKVAITSLHDDYFADVQRDLAILISMIIALDDPVTRALILTIEGIDDDRARVNDLFQQIVNSSRDPRRGRDLTLELLRSVRGRSLQEQGRIREMPTRTRTRTAMEDQYMRVDEAPTIQRGGSPNLEGVGDLFQ